MIKKATSQEDISDEVYSHRARIAVIESTVPRIEKMVEKIVVSIEAMNLKLDTFVTKEELKDKMIDIEKDGFPLFLRKLGERVLSIALAGGLLIALNKGIGLF